jgi:hydroxyacylglutathione hydrolase
MLVVTSQDPGPLSNSYLIGDREGGRAILLDGGTNTGPIHRAVAELDLKLERIFITHRHPDHLQYVPEYVERYGIPVCGHRLESEACGGFDQLLNGGEEFDCGELKLRVLHIPGHTAGHIALVVHHAQERAVFTADTIFKGSVGGTRGVGHTCFEDLRHSVLEILMKLEPDTIIYPGHSDPSTVARELAHNPFVQAWAGHSPEEPQAAEFRGEPVQLLLRGPDYDGGTKCWVRWPQNGSFDVLPGSMVDPA